MPGDNPRPWRAETRPGTIPGRGGSGHVGDNPRAWANGPCLRHDGDRLGSRAVPEVEVMRDGGVLTLTLNRPDVLNAFNSAMHKALASGLKDARDPEIRAVVITGAGRGFCVGQDLTEF